MSKALRYIFYFLIGCVLLRACGMVTAHEHEWQEATCTAAETCSICGNTKGKSLGHQWISATCTDPETCGVCGVTLGKPRSHKYSSATCETPRICSMCGAQKGAPYGHDFDVGEITVQPTCQSTGERTSHCRRYSCDKTQISVVPPCDCKPGNWEVVEDATTSTLVTKARYCTMCGKELERKEVNVSSSSSGDTTGSGGSGSGSNFNTYNNTGQQNTTASYVLNTNTKKFHRPSCRDVPKIAAKNYSTSNSSRSDLISRGYSACGHCSP